MTNCINYQHFTKQFTRRLKRLYHKRCVQAHLSCSQQATINKEVNFLFQLGSLAPIKDTPFEMFQMFAEALRNNVVFAPHHFPYYYLHEIYPTQTFQKVDLNGCS